MFNLATDADDPVLGFTSGWVRALAERVAAVDVVTMRAGRLDLPANVRVHSVGKEAGLGEARRAARFYRLVGGLLRHNRYDACFAHMMPLFTVMGAPLLRARRVPTTLWYTHQASPPLLRLAEVVVQRVVTASPESFRGRRRKVVVTGHGIDTAFFAPTAQPPAAGPVRVLSVGRVAPVKRLELLVDAVALLAPRLAGPVELRLVGPVAERDLGFAEALRARADAAGIGPGLRMVGPVAAPAVVDEYRQAAVMANLSATGSFDKAVLEAMSCGTPVVAANAAFARLLAPIDQRLAVPAAADAGALASSLLSMATMEAGERQVLAALLRESVVRDHSLDRLADLLVGTLLVGKGRRGASGGWR